MRVRVRTETARSAVAVVSRPLVGSHRPRGPEPRPAIDVAPLGARVPSEERAEDNHEQENRDKDHSHRAGGYMRGCHVIHVTRSFGAGGPAGRRAGGPAGRRAAGPAGATLPMLPLAAERLTGWVTVAATVNPRQRGEPGRWKVKKLLVLVITGLAVTAPSASGAA